LKFGLRGGRALPRPLVVVYKEMLYRMLNTSFEF